MFELCTAWIADNIENLKIKAVLCTGDLVEQNENIVRNRKMLNQTSREMWEASSRAFERLDNKIPYIISTGNHEYGYRSSENGKTQFPAYFPFERNSAWRDICVSDFPNRSGIVSLENSAFEFFDPNWGKLLVITTEFAPRDEVLEWAKELAAKSEYKEHKVIFMTHSFCKNALPNESREGYAISPRYGDKPFKKLVGPSDNIYGDSGRTGKPGDFDDSVAYRVDKNSSGKDVRE